MEDVTDTIFRAILLKNAQPNSVNIVFTEFVPTDGLCHEVGKEKVSHRMILSPLENELIEKQNIKKVVQIWGADPEKFSKSVAAIEQEYDFDGYDINMGCPMKKIMKQAGGAALIENPNMAKEIILAVKEATQKPVSVKTRTGLTQHDTENWISTILETQPNAITLHGRTRKMMYKGLADWDEIQKAATLIKQNNPNIAIIGNGDIQSLTEAQDKVVQYQVDGAMIGRALMGNPWFFSATPTEQIKLAERLELLIYHTKIFTEFWGEEKAFNVLKKFFKAYIHGFPKAAEMRGKFMGTKSLSDIEIIVKGIVG